MSQVVVSSAKNRLGATALTLGVVSLVSLVLLLAIFMPHTTQYEMYAGSIQTMLWTCVVTGIAAVPFGAAGRRAADRGEATNKRIAVAGHRIGICMTVLFGVCLLIGGCSYAALTHDVVAPTGGR